MAILRGNIVFCPLCGSQIESTIGWTGFFEEPTFEFNIDIREAWVEFSCTSKDCDFRMHLPSREEISEIVRIKLLLHKKFGKISKQEPSCSS